jgi:hypothetical protein
MLSADPSLTADGVKPNLTQTALQMPGFAESGVGADHFDNSSAASDAA